MSEITVYPPTNVKILGIIDKYYYNYSNSRYYGTAYIYFSFDLGNYIKDDVEIKATDKSQEVGPIYNLPYDCYSSVGLSRYKLYTGYLSYGNFHIAYIDDKYEASFENFCNYNNSILTDSTSRKNVTSHVYTAQHNVVYSDSAKVLDCEFVDRTTITTGKSYYLHVCNLYIEKDGTKHASEWITASYTIKSKYTNTVHWYDKYGNECTYEDTSTPDNGFEITNNLMVSIFGYSGTYVNDSNSPNGMHTNGALYPLGYIGRYKETEDNIISDVPFIVRMPSTSNSYTQFDLESSSSSDRTFCKVLMSDLYIHYEKDSSIMLDYNYDSKAPIKLNYNPYSSSSYFSLNRTGYVFDGWTFDKDGLEARHPISGYPYYTSDLSVSTGYVIPTVYKHSNGLSRTIYAQWKEGNTVTLKTDLKGGTFSSTPSTYTKEGNLYIFTCNLKSSITLPEVNRKNCSHTSNGTYVDEYKNTIAVEVNCLSQNYYNIYPDYTYVNNMVCIACDKNKGNIPLATGVTSSLLYSTIIWPPDNSLREHFNEDLLEAKPKDSKHSFFGYYKNGEKLDLNTKYGGSISSESDMYKADISISSKDYLSVCHNGTFNNAKPYIYTDGKWKEFRPHVCNKKWKDTIYKISSFDDFLKESNPQNLYSIGDAFDTTLNGTCFNFTADNMQVNFKILGFNHNRELESPDITNCTHFILGGTKNSGSSDVALVDSGYNNSATSGFIMNPERSNVGGWEYSYMRTILLVNLLNMFPENIRNYINTIIKYTNNVSSNGTDTYIRPTVDKLFLLSEFEVYGVREYANQYEQSKQKRYQYYANGNSIYRRYHNNTSSNTSHWLRSTASSSSYFCVASGDSRYERYTNNSNGIAPAFVINNIE